MKNSGRCSGCRARATCASKCSVCLSLSPSFLLLLHLLLPLARSLAAFAADTVVTTTRSGSSRTPDVPSLAQSAVRIKKNRRDPPHRAARPVARLLCCGRRRAFIARVIARVIAIIITRIIAGVIDRTRHRAACARHRSSSSSVASSSFPFARAAAAAAATTAPRRAACPVARLLCCRRRRAFIARVIGHVIARVIARPHHRAACARHRSP